MLFAMPEGMIHGISAYFLAPETFKPKMHFKCKDALVPVKANLPYFAGFPASFGGSDERVAW